LNRSVQRIEDNQSSILGTSGSYLMPQLKRVYGRLCFGTRYDRITSIS